MRRRSNRAVQLLGGAALSAILASLASPVLAQGAQAETVEEVVVTGTMIRGVAPVGTNVIGVNEEQIQKLGAVSTQQVLAQIPTITSQFNRTPSTVTGIGATTQRPNIRNLGGAGGNTTLVLIDGRNVVGAGILMTTPDSSILPPSVLQRVEVMADGGSSLYGADAVGGIINYITKRKADGFEVSGHYGVADPGYWAGDLNLTAGTSWTGGSAYVAASYRENSNLTASKRSYPRQDLRPQGGDDFRVTNCAAPNVTVGAVTFAAPGFSAGSLNRCDTSLFDDIVPEERQWGLFGSFSQELSDSLSFNGTAYWSERKTTQANAQLTASGVVVPQTNPFFRRLALGTSETLAFSFSPVLGDYAYSNASLKQWGVTPELTAKLGGDWQLKAMFNYGRSETETFSPLVNPVALALAAAGTTTTTALNPFDLSQTNPAVINAITNYGKGARAIQTLTDVRAIADGPLFSLPGGDVRMAVGAEHQIQTSRANSVDGPPGGFGDLTIKDADRNVTSVFAQVVVPVIGVDNALPLVEGFTLDASIRYDDYSDFGDTTNPKVGFTWQVGAGFSVRGNYGTAFNAPSLADTTGAVDSRAQVLSVSPIRAPTSPITDLFRPTIVLAGGNPDLKPQTADTWSVGVDWKPDFLPMLQAGLTYWSVELEDAITVVPPGFPASLFTVPAFQKFITINPTLAQAQAATAGLVIDGAPSVAALYSPFSSPYAIIDARRKNVGSLYVSGLDFYANYAQPVSFGTVFASVSGTYTLNRESEAYDGAPKTDLLDANVSRLQLGATLGVTWDKLTASATVNHSEGYDVTGAGTQTRTDSFSPVNLAFVYDFGGETWDRDLTLTLNIDNVFDEEVPFLNISPGIGAPVNGSTLGRFVNLGVRKRF